MLAQVAMVAMEILLVLVKVAWNVIVVPNVLVIVTAV